MFAKSCDVVRALNPIVNHSITRRIKNIVEVRTVPILQTNLLVLSDQTDYQLVYPGDGLGKQDEGVVRLVRHR